MIPLRALPALLLLWTALPAAAEEERTAGEWLARMARAAHALNYEGTFVYQHDGSLQTMQIFHALDGGGERERLVTLDGASREVIRDKEKVICILPDNRAVMVEEAGGVFPINLSSQSEELERYYQASVAGTERVAGLRARKIVVAPRDAYRYGQNVWLDEQSALLLKSEVVDERGEVVEQLVFTRLQIHEKPLPAALFEPKGMEGGVVWERLESGAPGSGEGAGEWRVERLPEGFHEVLRRRHRISPGKSPVEHMIFSDGLVSVSVFVEAGEGASRALPGSARKGAVNVYTRLVEGHRVTVLGEVPAGTVRMMGESVARGGAK